ncbi:two component transcriptional regulator, LytTR family [Chryseolinea serpens]|uniref:Two component transcriptional regulator, LytTR family n=1 Tax=Chryseolinea serpens TaxID=947013 RepID=A0A1M5LSA1_9BACT|nr:response regulator [Chryseolinea serpens]SHG67928.1 two component transcriptional regulator, LytTR family [Chryseolinea serpens]
MSTIKILAVEDDPIYAESLDFVVQELGYELTGIADNATDALRLLEENPPDLILMDIEIHDTLTGIELAARINRNQRIPIIYVTAFKDKDIFQQAKLTGPVAYIIKPYDPVSLQSAIELALFSASDQPKPAQEVLTVDAFFIRDNTRLVKVKLDEILMVEVDEKYCFIVTGRKRHIINMRLKDLQEKLPRDEFVQVHRSFLVRKSAIDEINTGDQTLRVAEKTIPIGKTYKDHLLATLNYLS